MEHIEAVQMKAAEKYVLGELSDEQREQFEEHYFDCTDCATDVQAMATFVTAGRMISEEDAAAKQAGKEVKQRHGWFAWLRPVVAIPAIGALAAVVIFQNAVQIPALKERTTGATLAPVFTSSYHLQGSVRGENRQVVAVRPTESFALNFDFTPSQSFPSYTGRLVEEAERTIMSFPVPGEDANKELHVVIPAGATHAGKYNLIFNGTNGSENPDPKANEVQSFSFAVETRP
jgi:hypothetical protein